MTAAPSSSPRRRGWLLLVAAVVVLIAVIGWSAFHQDKTMPDVTFIDLQGRQITANELQGKVTILNFWATSCTTCVKEMPAMVQTYEKYKESGLEFIAVAMAYDPPNYVLNFVETRKLPFTVALDSRGELAHAFDDVKLTPTTLIIDKQGRIIKRYVGEPDFTALHQLLEKLLAA